MQNSVESSPPMEIVELRILTRAKDEIIDHVLSGKVPVGVHSLAGVHEHVDTYHLGFNGEYSREALKAMFSTNLSGNQRDIDQYMKLIIGVGNKLDRWIQNGVMFKEAALKASPEGLDRAMETLLERVEKANGSFPESVHAEENLVEGPPCLIGFESNGMFITDPLHGTPSYISLRKEEVRAEYGIDEDVASIISQANTFLENTASLMEMRRENLALLVFRAAKIVESMGGDATMNMDVTVSETVEGAANGPEEHLHLAKKIARDFADKFMRKPEAADGEPSDLGISAWKDRVRAAASVSIGDDRFVRDQNGAWTNADPGYEPEIGIHTVEWSNRYQASSPDEAVDIAVDDLTYPEGNTATIVVVHLGDQYEHSVVIDMERYARSGNPDDVDVLKSDLKGAGQETLPNEEAERLRAQPVADAALNAVPRHEDGDAP